VTFKPDITGRRQQLTRQLIIARVQVIATARIRRALLRNVYMVTTQAGSKRLYCDTIARPPARIVVVIGRRCVGGPVDGGLSNNHGTCLSNEKRISTTVESSHAARD